MSSLVKQVVTIFLRFGHSCILDHCYDFKGARNVDWAISFHVPRLGLNGRGQVLMRSYRRVPMKSVDDCGTNSLPRGSPIDNSRPLYWYEKNATTPGHQKQWKREFH
eukprot:scaffold204929_cov51-Attheya_sp.AAC.1